MTLTIGSKGSFTSNVRRVDVREQPSRSQFRLPSAFAPGSSQSQISLLPEHDMILYDTIILCIWSFVTPKHNLDNLESVRLPRVGRRSQVVAHLHLPKKEVRRFSRERRAGRGFRCKSDAFGRFGLTAPFGKASVSRSDLPLGHPGYRGSRQSEYLPKPRHGFSFP